MRRQTRGFVRKYAVTTTQASHLLFWEPLVVQAFADYITADGIDYLAGVTPAQFEAIVTACLPKLCFPSSASMLARNPATLLAYIRSRKPLAAAALAKTANAA